MFARINSNMNEFVYRLNLPPLTDVLLNKDILYNEEKYDTIYRQLTTDCIKPEWLTFNNYNWNSVLYFYKNNSSGIIHLDRNDRSHLPHNPCVWGINWIYNNNGIMEYWPIEDILHQTLDTRSKYITVCYSDKEPHRTYHMTEGAYLVNASLPHKATGESKRRALSLRDTTCNETWDEVVDKFKNYII